MNCFMIKKYKDDNHSFNYVNLIYKKCILNKIGIEVKNVTLINLLIVNF